MKASLHLTSVRNVLNSLVCIQVSRLNCGILKTKIIFLFIYFAAVLNLPAQTITGFTIVPANPTPADTVYIYIQCDFTSGPCDGATFLNSISGNTIDGGSLHCVGSSGVLCTDVDTLVIPPLSAGNYTVSFTMVPGMDPGCIPGIIPIDFDTTSFTVSTVTGILHPDHPGFSIVPNPSDGNFTIGCSDNMKAVLEIFTITGRLLETRMIANDKTSIHVDLPAGIYIAFLENDMERVASHLIIEK